MLSLTNIALLLFAFLLPYCLCLTNKGTLKWVDYGHDSTLTLMSTNAYGVGVTDGGATMSMDYNFGPRVYPKKSNGDWYRFNSLIGDSLKFNVNLKAAACRYNAALYLIELPSNAAADYYCDAQLATADTACVEIDIMEANRHAFQFTVHCGDGKATCGNGCGINWRATNGYGPRASKIDTNYAFTVEASFSKTKYCVRLSQNGKTIVGCFTDSTCGNSLISKLSTTLASGKMALVTSYWGMGSDTWLDGTGCVDDYKPSTSIVYISSLHRVNSVTVSGAQNDVSAASENTLVTSSGLMAIIGCIVVIAIVVLIVVIVALVVVLQRKSNEIV